MYASLFTMCSPSCLAILCSASALFYTTILAQEVGECVTQDSPNPLAENYPNFVSGNLNGTTLIVPISLETARQVIPAGYAILEHAYRELLPSSFPEGAYPMMAVGVHDHDIQFPAYGTHPADFSVRYFFQVHPACSVYFSSLSLINIHMYPEAPAPFPTLLLSKCLRKLTFCGVRSVPLSSSLFLISLGIIIVHSDGRQQCSSQREMKSRSAGLKALE